MPEATLAPKRCPIQAFNHTQRLKGAGLSKRASTADRSPGRHETSRKLPMSQAPVVGGNSSSAEFRFRFDSEKIKNEIKKILYFAPVLGSGGRAAH